MRYIDKTAARIGRDSRGIALPGAILALVVIAALVTGGVYSANQEHQVSQGNIQANAAFQAAERGIQDVLGKYDLHFFEDTIGAVGTVYTIGPNALTVGNVQTRYTVNIRRLATRLFLLDSEGEVLSGGKYAGAKRRITQMVRTPYMHIPRDRAIQTQAPISMRGNSLVTGNDTIPDDWSDCTDEGMRTGIVSNDTTTVDIKGGNKKLEGNPAMDEEDLDVDDFEVYGDMTFSELRGLADKNYTTGNYSPAPAYDAGVCDLSVKDNWGEPKDATSDCHLYYPTIYMNGDIQLASGWGQGILLVEGDVHMSGGFEFYGIIFIRGDLTLSGKGNKITGTVNIMDDGDGEASDFDKAVGNTEVSLSTCAIERAYRYNSKLNRPFPVDQHSWVDLTGAGEPTS